jgi:ATP-dependent Clp protease ATP-binding subunit ClpC
MPDDFAEFVIHLSDNARTSLQHANIIAQGYNSPYIGTEHLLLGILAQGPSVGAKILADFGITLERAQDSLNLAPLTTVIAVGIKNLSETAKLTLKMSWDIAQDYNQETLGTEHILYSLITQKNSRASILIQDLGVDLSELSAELESFFRRLDARNNPGETLNSNTLNRKISQKKGSLELFGTDLTELARNGKIDPMIGRATELERVITILSRRSKNNPVLIGEPGVGKTAIVEGLAQRISNEEVPDHLLDKRLIQIDLAGMVAGTKYRGEFEDRLKKLMSEIVRQKDVIIFIDELHLLVGAGSAEGSVDAANILKPALARGEIHLIGATTLEEYRKNIEKDTALERRLQTIIVKEPNLKETVLILKGLKEKYELHHGVKITDEVLEDTVYMADRYISERFMPDKAIDVLDEASAMLRVKDGKRPSKVRDYTKQLKNLNDKMEEAVVNEDYERAALYKTRISQLNDMIAEIQKEFEINSQITLTSEDIASALSRITNIPVSKIKKSEAVMLKNLESHLGKYIIGQEDAVKSVARAIRRSRSGIASSSRPIGSFVFMGPTGVGKTELARVIAKEVFGSDEALVKIDMSEFAEKHSASRLLGAPAGYIGYEDGGKLTDKIKRQPYSVVLFDEIEKAHRDVFNLLLQVLEDGKLTDGQGHEVDFSNTIIILTSNLGAAEMNKESILGFSAKTKDEKSELEEVHKANKKTSRQALEKNMKPELINRFDDIITFRALTRDEINKIFNILIDDLKTRLIRKGIDIVITTSAKSAIIDNGYDKNFGARPLRRAIQDMLEHKIAEGIINGQYEKGTVVNVTARKSELILSVNSEG